MFDRNTIEQLLYPWHISFLSDIYSTIVTVWSWKYNTGLLVIWQHLSQCVTHERSIHIEAMLLIHYSPCLDRCGVFGLIAAITHPL